MKCSAGGRLPAPVWGLYIENNRGGWCVLGRVEGGGKRRLVIAYIRRHIGAVPRALSIAEQAMAMGKEYPHKKD